MIPETGAAVAPRTPNPQPIPDFEVIVSPRPRPGTDYSHFGGYTLGSVIYQDANAVMWYLGPWRTVNRGNKGLRRVHRGSEDTVDLQT